MRFAPDRIDILCGWSYRLSIAILLSTLAVAAQAQNRCSASGRLGGEKFTANNCAAAVYGKSVAIWFNENPISVQELGEFQASAEVPDKKEGKQRTLVLIKFCPGGGATKASATAVKVIDLHTNHAKSPLYGIQWTVKSPRDFKAGTMTGEIKPAGTLVGKIAGSWGKTTFNLDFDVKLPAKEATSGVGCGS
jgi:hypothetical protein